MSTLMPGLGRWLLRWVAFAGLWLALTDTRVFPELVAGAVAATLGATLSTAVTRPGRPKTVSKSVALLRLGPLRLARPAIRLVADTGLLCAALWRRLVLRHEVRGSFRAARYRPEAARDSSAGRVLIEIWGSLTPNRVVVGVDEERDLILTHELVRSEQPLDPLGDR
jgi:hypothetical protein